VSLLDWLAPLRLHRSVVVHLIAEPDTAIRGVLWQSRGAWLLLKKAYVLKPGLNPEPADGDVLVHRSNVAFVQVVE
jgi:hypothetical protein